MSRNQHNLGTTFVSVLGSFHNEHKNYLLHRFLVHIRDIVLSKLDVGRWVLHDSGDHGDGHDDRNALHGDHGPHDAHCRDDCGALHGASRDGLRQTAL